MTHNELVEAMKGMTATATDEIAAKAADLYPVWRPDAHVKAGDRFTYEGILWKCITEHDTQADRAPSINTASLWTAINVEHVGTVDDPIPVPEQLTSFEYAWGKYYKEGETLYLCNRQGGKDGDTYTLAYKPSALVGQYFAVA